LPSRQDPRFVSELAAPPEALYGTQSARGVAAMQSLRRRAAAMHVPFVDVGLRGTGGQADLVPLSWALSHAAQAEIRDLLCKDAGNAGQLDKLGAALGRPGLGAAIQGDKKICP
jgi:hypothetical protein